jgi:hypothetical protein
LFPAGTAEGAAMLIGVDDPVLEASTLEVVVSVSTDRRIRKGKEIVNYIAE